jgi:MFS transporter, FSR family, fosmidomycin resistance protein
MSKQLERVHFQSGKVSIIAFSHFMHDIYPAFLPVLLPLLIDKLDISLTLIGTLPFFLRFPTLFNPVIGNVADRLPMRYVVIFTPALTAFAMSLVGLADSFFVLAMLLTVAGFSSALYHLPTPVMIKRVAGSRLGKGMSFYMTGGELARSAGPMVAMVGLSIWPLEETYKLMFFGLAITAVLYYYIRKDSIKKQITKNKSKSKTGGLRATWRKLRLFYTYMTIFVFTKALLVIACTYFLPVYFQEKGESLWFAGAGLSILQLSGAVGAMTSGTLSDRFGRKNILLIISVLSPIILVFFAISSGWIVFPILLVLGLLIFSVNPVLLAMVQEAEEEYPTAANSIFMTTNFVLSSICAFMFGLLGDLISMETAYIITAVVAAFGIPLVFKIDKYANQTS